MEQKPRNGQMSRRELTKWMLSASLGSLPAVRGMASTAVFSPAAPGVRFAAVRSRIQQTIARGDATGVAVAVLQGGRIVWEEGFGWANREAGLKVTPHTPFSMASITKPFTTTTLMTLIAEGRLGLDEPANKYLAQGKLIGTNGRAEAATVRMLGAHVSGLPGMYESYDADEVSLMLTPEALLRAYGRLAYPPASCYEYSNLGFAALHAIASALTHTEFGALMMERVLDPLGLRDTFFASDSNRVPSGAARYDPLGHVIPYYRTSTPASGELYASAHDVARFLLFNMRSGPEGQGTVLRAREIDELHRPVFTGPSGVATTFGWFKGETAFGTPFFFKTGGDPGVANRVCFVPSKDVGCVVFTNQSNAQELAYGVCDELMTNDLPEWRRPEESSGFPSALFATGAEFSGRWQGLLEDGGARTTVQLTVASSGLVTLALGGNRAEAVSSLRSEGPAMTGVSTGRIDSPDAIRTGATTLRLKLLPQGNQLVGRVFAEAGDPNFKNVSLPYAVTLDRG